ncbi:unnamed protein product [Acanthocheilonema viteae]|uniref:Protein S-acyltransferase n=1 Tax=Acanthocheilonema viteae TaxID=6277 RepID=A0A498S9Q0_ACAVI|nr:unnamed protein product [Acanthocheilonema viteae]
MSLRKVCKSVSQALPATVAWSLIIVCTGCFFYLLAPAIILQFSVWGYVMCALDAVLFLFVMSNLFMATTMDPGVHPVASAAEETQLDDFRSPLYKNVEINGITVRMKWCVTCKFYRPPRASHCSVCNRQVHRCFRPSLSMGTQLRWSTQLSTDLLTRPNMCSIVLMALCVLLAVPVVGLTGFHVVLVVRGRTTNEQVTGKFRSGYNPFTIGCWGNVRHTLCASQYPSFETVLAKKGRKGGKGSKNGMPSVIYVPDKNSFSKGGGLIRMRQVPEDDQSVGTALSLGHSFHNFPEKGSKCNLFDEQDTKTLRRQSAIYHAAVEESMRSAHSKIIMQSSANDSRTSPVAINDNESVPSPSTLSNFEMIRSESVLANINTDPACGFRFVENGGQLVDKSRPLKFTDAVRIHESLSAHNVNS